MEPIKDSELLFTPASVLDFLLQIDELQDVNISMTEDEVTGQISFAIGNSVYDVSDALETEIPVNDEVVNLITDVQNEVYDEITYSDYDTVESSIIGEIGKSLLVGGLVRLTKKLLF